MDEKELQENFFWTINTMERQMLLETNAPQFSVERYKQIVLDYGNACHGWFIVKLNDIHHS